MAKKITLTEKQKEAIVKKFAPKTIHGNGKDSFNACIRGCAYAFCGGKENYDAKLYQEGKMAWFKAYNTVEYRSTCSDYDAETDTVTVKANKPPKTSRGSSRKQNGNSDLEARVASLEKGQEEQKDILLKILAKLG